MNRRRRPHAHVNHERWLASYADLLTLLFAFFVVLYASSQVDNKQMSKLAGAIGGAFHELGAFQAFTPDSTNNARNAPIQDALRPIAATNTSVPGEGQSSGQQSTPMLLPNLKRDLEQALADEIQRREVALRIGSEGLVVSLREIGFFDSGSATLKPGSETSIKRIAGILRERAIRMRVEGHTDNVPINNSQFASNWELSTARATEMIKLLITQYGFSPIRLSAAGYGEFHPLASNHTLDGRRQNRRLDLVILEDPSHPTRPTPGIQNNQLVSGILR